MVALAAIAFGWLIAGRLLQPLHQITGPPGGSPAPRDRGLHERIALAGPHDEVKELADTFDVMLARLDQAFDGQRRFIANASHELRTPLTLNRTLLEVAIDPGTPRRSCGSWAGPCSPSTPGTSGSSTACSLLAGRSGR